MAGGMEQGEIVEPVTATMHAPDDVVGMPPGLDGHGLPAVRASAFLSPPEHPSSTVQRLAHSALFALFEVELPLWVEWIGFGFDLDVASDGYRTDINQLDPSALAIGVLHLRCERPPLERRYPIPSG